MSKMTEFGKDYESEGFDFTRHEEDEQKAKTMQYIQHLHSKKTSFANVVKLDMLLELLARKGQLLKANEELLVLDSKFHGQTATRDEVAELWESTPEEHATPERITGDSGSRFKNLLARMDKAGLDVVSKLENIAVFSKEFRNIAKLLRIKNKDQEFEVGPYNIEEATTRIAQYIAELNKEIAALEGYLGVKVV
jgi:hypothetical protein